MLELHGRQKKSVVVDKGIVKIVKGGSLFSSPREKTIPIKNITSVEIKKPGAFFAGFIQFSIAGGMARESSFLLLVEHTVRFRMRIQLSSPTKSHI